MNKTHVPTDPTGRLKFRWYATVPTILCMVIAFGGLAYDFYKLVSTPITVGMGANQPAIYLGWKPGELCSFITLGGYGLWLMWALPYFESGDPTLVWHGPCKKRWQRIMGQLWVFPLGSISIAIMVLIFSWILTKTDGGFYSDYADPILIFTLLGFGVCASVVSALLTPIVRRRFQTHIQGPRCLRCAFDLRGNTDAKTCPECGAEVPRLDDEQQ